MSTEEEALVGLLEALRARYDRKYRRAASAFYKERTLKCPRNCRYGGRALGEHLSVCTLKAVGADEGGAGTCFAEKAVACSAFTLRRRPAIIIEDFKNIPQPELFLRWPSLNELNWIIGEVEGRLQKLREPREGAPGQPKKAVV